MKETDPSEQQNGWNISAIAKVLRTEPQPCHDNLLGPGYRLHLKETKSQLALYPERFVVRYRHARSQLNITNINHVDVAEDHVYMESLDQDTCVALYLHARGTVAFSANPQGGSLDESDAGPASESTATEQEEQQQKQEKLDNRVVLTGRIGRDPELRTTSKGKQVTKVPLAIHDGETTKWHTVLFFDEKAKVAAEALHKGDLATVVGYKHQREITTKTGIKKQIEEIYGVATQLPKTQKDSKAERRAPEE